MAGVEPPSFRSEHARGHVDAVSGEKGVPLAATRGSGSSTAVTTRATPAATSASEQGGVRPWWAQGSSVT